MENISGLMQFVNENYGVKYNAFEIADMFEIGVSEVKAVARDLRIDKNGVKILDAITRATYVSPEEIEERKKEVQAKWSDADWNRRATGLQRQPAETKIVVNPIRNIEDLQ